MDDLRSPRARVFVLIITVLAFLLGMWVSPSDTPESCKYAFQFADSALASVREALPMRDPDEFYAELDVNVFDETLYKDYKAKCLEG